MYFYYNSTQILTFSPAAFSYPALVCMHASFLYPCLKAHTWDCLKLDGATGNGFHSNIINWSPDWKCKTCMLWFNEASYTSTSSVASNKCCITKTPRANSKPLSCRNTRPKESPGIPILLPSGLFAWRFKDKLI